jgi:hypothetical protein
MNKLTLRIYFEGRISGRPWPTLGPLYDKPLSVKWADAGKHYAVRTDRNPDVRRSSTTGFMLWSADLKHY